MIDTLDKMLELMLSMQKDMDKVFAQGMQGKWRAAAARIRRDSVTLAKLSKQFRKESIAAAKNM